jgi:amino acid adenylation domain-containing protein
MESKYSEPKKRLLEKCFKGELELRSKSARIPRRPAGERAPLSHGQQQVWLHAQMAPEVPVYNEPVTIHYTGELNIAALEKAFNAVLLRHEAWRTSIQVIEGKPCQQVHEDLTVSIPFTDLRELPAEQREAEALALATADAKIPIDFRTAPLFRVRLVQLAEKEYRLYLTLCHIIFDGVALYRVFLPELVALYNEFALGKSAHLPDLAFQYPDYACWQRENYAREQFAKDVEFWRARLSAGFPERYLPTDRPHPSRQSFRGSMFPFTLNATLTANIRQYCRTEGASIFQVLLAAFGALLNRYSGEDRIPIGSVTAGRNLPGTEALLGYFLNTIIFPIDATGNPSFRELVKRAGSWTLDALEHDRVPFEYLVRELRAERSNNHNPLFQALFSLEPALPPIDSAWRLTQMDVDTGATKYDLYLELDEREQEILARFHYSTDLFDRDTIAAMAEHWTRLLGAGVSNGSLRISELPLLGEAERHKLLVECNDTRREIAPTCIHDLFELQCEQSADKIAVTSESGTLTYRQLNERANQVAHFLRERGIHPDDAVGICVARTPEMLVGLLGILKAGGCYVPLDPRLPEDRLSFMVHDVKPKLVLSDRASSLPVLGSEVVLLDQDWPAIAMHKKDDPEFPVNGHHLAYVLYTSGSTGKPKGVAVAHRSVVNLLSSMQQTLGFTPEDILLAITPLSFDIATLEIFLPLIKGGRIVLANSTDVVDGVRLRDLLLEHQVTMLQATPVTWRLLLEAGWEGSPNLKALCGGEVLAPDLAKELVHRSGAAWNGYGPTETTIYSTVYRVTGAEESTVPIGLPVANTSVYVLDANLNPVPVNVPGQIYIGGSGMARGYIGQPELTDQSFLRNPLDAERYPRIYRTGDLGRLRKNGELEYLGRVDQQVKIRGQRIELGEIESVLMTHPAIRQAVVLLTGDSGQRRLCAYIVCKEGPDIAELRRHLRVKLPELMVPTSYRLIPALPLLPSGKVNRSALLTMRSTLLVDAGQWVAPRNEVESKLAGIWCELLGLEQVGIEQNFFELGGHSLLGLQAVARIRKVLEVELPIRILFEAPTIANLAVEVERARALGLRARAAAQIPQLARLSEEKQKSLLVELAGLSAEQISTLLESALKIESELNSIPSSTGGEGPHRDLG